MIAENDHMNYSAQNAYARTYAVEFGTPVQALLMYGLTEIAKPFAGDLFAFSQQPYLRFHNAAFKPQLLARYYWLTQDREFVRATESLWRPELEPIMTNRESSSGLLPKEAYCGDINTKVYSLSTDAKRWRAGRDLAAVLEELGESNAEIV
ncbi:MAG: hypothetical protein NZ899_09925 [Thermoguttaceae bacterium]|nr:hypothetical protein [Thermoguttaceae bacterium]MDW8077552.1 hypothetical protein [Thermoguttaceae bacterium]